MKIKNCAKNLRFLSKDKGQVSIFVIMGFIIFIAASTIFYINSAKNKEEILPGVFVSTQEIPTELDPLNGFISQCLDDVSTRGLRLIGDHGGYIDVDSFDLTKQTFKTDRNPTESDVVTFAPDSNLKIPYWWYLESGNQCEGTCVFSSKRPALRGEDSSVEKQLNRFIEGELPNCLDNFQNLKREGFEIRELSGMKADTRVTEEDVVVILDYELQVGKNNVTSNLEQFFVRIPVNLQKIYNLATEITNLEQEYRFLERQTMNLISSFTALDQNKLPPISEMRFEFGSTTNWVKSDVKEKVSQILTSYVPLYQVDGTRNFNRDLYSSNIKQRIYDSMIVPIADQEFSDLDVTFNYLDFWPIYFDLNCNGEICQSESVSSNILAAIGLQRYNFAYDVSYPVMVEIFDESALDSRGYKFNIFLESNVRNNKELKSDFVPLEAAKTQTSLLCGMDNRNSADVTIEAVDSLSMLPLEDVSVTFTVAGESCYIGSTGDDGSVTARFPAGTAGGILSLIKPDYISKSRLFDASLDKKISIEARLDPVKDKSILVKKKLVEKTSRGWEFTNRVSDLKQNEEAFVTLTRISPLEEEEFRTALSQQGPNEEEARLAPGDYEVDIQLNLRESIRIPERRINVRTGLFSEREVAYPGVEFNENKPYHSGGLRLNMTITEQDLKKDTLVLFAVSPALYDVPEHQRKIEDLDQTSRIDSYSKVFAALLKPIFQ
jgi:hypothetical protein